MTDGDQTPRPRLRDWLRLLRPAQWTKNAVVLAAFFFAYWDRSQPGAVTWRDLAVVLPAALLFSLVSSGVYIINDLRDVEADRVHPVKRHRPIAAGRIGGGPAAVIAGVLLIGALAAAHLLRQEFGTVLCVYVLIQLAYTGFLKRVALLDILLIAFGFVLRALAGAVALPGIAISPWLLLCTFLLAVFLALCKRRHEKRLLEGDAGDLHRPSLQGYSVQLLDQLIATTAGATIVSYAIYTLWPQTVDKFGTRALGFTIPYVMFGIFRYLYLVYSREEGGRPERTLLTDGPLLATIALFAVTIAAICVLAAMH